MRNFRVRRAVQNMTGLCKKPSSAPRIGLNCTLVQVKKGLGPPALGPLFYYAHDLRAESVIQPCQTCSTHHPLHQASGFVRVSGSVNARVQEIYILVTNGVTRTTHNVCTTSAELRTTNAIWTFQQHHLRYFDFGWERWGKEVEKTAKKVENFHIFIRNHIQRIPIFG